MALYRIKVEKLFVKDVGVKLEGETVELNPADYGGKEELAKLADPLAAERKARKAATEEKKAEDEALKDAEEEADEALEQGSSLEALFAGDDDAEEEAGEA